ncbi:type VI secretion protein IcmF/TssM N-terminal domain-containing protein [Herbaspirillum huttiense]|uniref:type VI secretion protein IcmF/TssM N-terminal domain-containing protein n=1 Tax=Herbaspirillum huttiense TaxID=863372 RepID=UPI0009FD8A84|nr:type VI secretion protein IcmF/TssM N-terminal domain-containing protein [Herbaspirillum huttiense]
MKTFGKFLLWLVLLVLLALGCWGAALYMAWPLWVALALFCGVIGVYFLSKFLRRVYIVMRSRSKLAQQDVATRSSVAQAASPEALLRRKWKEAVATLRGSSLRRRGNPLYVLPWYIVVGKSGTGKTTALTRARLSSPIQRVRQSGPVEQTQNYDWWYFDQAVVIDSAGRYVDAQDSEADRREWELGLDLLARYRPREGIDGLVLAIGTDRLANVSRDELAEEGRVVRARIEQLIQMFGKRFPIYVLVTKCDQLYGMEEWAKRMPENTLEQAMGYLSDEIVGDRSAAQFLQGAFDSIGARLQQLRIALVARMAGAAGEAASPELLLFPNELQNLRPKLELFLNACLADNPYLERPFLRGLFFSSGLQEGGAVSSLLGQVLPPVASHPNTHAGLFLHDFFGRILPQDRFVSRPAELVNRWRQVTRNLGVVAWILIASAVGIMITVSFVSNMETLSLVREKRPFDVRFSGIIEQDIPALQKVSDAVQLVERRNENWKTEWMVIATNMDDLEARLKLNFVSNFRKYVLPVTVQDYRDDFQRVQGSDPDKELPLLIRNLVRYTNLVHARMQGADRSVLKQMPALVHIRRYTPQQYQQLNELRLSHLAWTPLNDPYLADRLREDQATLDRVAYADGQMTWLAGLVADNGTPGTAASAVTAGDFWSTSTSGDANRSGAIVPAAFTKAGKKEIDAFLAEMEKAMDDGPRFLQHRAAFEQWYQDQRMLAWQRFVTDFGGPEKLLRTEPEWRSALGSITGSQSPYYRLIDRLNDEFQDVDTKELPGWLVLAREFRQLRGQAVRSGLASQTVGKAVQMVDSINAVGGQAVRETLAGQPVAGQQTLLKNLSAVDTLAKYQDEVNKLAADAVVGAGKSYQLAADFHQFGIDPAVKSSGAHVAAGALVQLKQLVGHREAADDAVWKLIEGPLNFTLTYIEQQASCELQKDWQAKVHWPLQTAPDKAAMLDQLYGAKGTVWAFADGIAKPFLERDARRFRIVETLGYSVPFTGAFLPTLNAAVDKRVAQLVSQQREEASKQAEQLQAQQAQLQAQQAQADIERTQAEIKQKTDALKAQVTQLSIVAQPTGVNGGALAKPFETVLSVQCAAGAQVLDNYNFPVSVAFPWAPGQCGEVSLQIKIDTLVLTKKYPGAMGVPNFLRDFRGGVRQFDVDEFPAGREGLEALGVKQISVRYNFEGQDAVLKTAQQLDAYAKLDKEAAAEKQKLQDEQFKRSQENIQAKLAAQAPRVGGQIVEPSNEVFLPPQIGACWDKEAVKDRSRNMQSIINELVNNQVSFDAVSTGSAPGVGSRTDPPVPATPQAPVGKSPVPARKP